ncbi:SPW_0924 family protein [Streptomyces yaizuensis]|uniref:SPW_0924 family protein n=1 Tax=Streptomyces yaizuensis TaxID=2989713 RepID=A0ABQ5P8H9_9ACTN|nr:SPW_0924 family protein [Streptomyces sp. YSPA8]GLF98556.1 SPW_0924 family protein [Streptomyces sp. YSPA8]
MRAFAAAAIGLTAAVALVLTVTAIGPPQDGTSPEPLLTTVPGPKK